MRPSVAHPSQECAATQKESQGSQDGDTVHPFRHEKGWGRLWALAQNLAHIDLTLDEIRLGRRPTCHVVYDARVIPNSALTLISGDHCRIIHAKNATESSYGPTFIEDLRYSLLIS